MTPSPEFQRDPFFVERDGRRIFAVFHPPAATSEAKGGVVFFAPFAEELNRTRRMATLLAEALSRAGFGTLVFDYSCTGDSDGTFRESRWDDWVDDGVAAIGWVTEKFGAPVTLVGLRLGAAVSLQCAVNCVDQVKGIVLWQPVTNGRNMLTQFLRIRIASALGGDENRETTTALRERFEAGETLEIGGYELAPELAIALDAISLADTIPATHAHTDWFEVITSGDGDLMPPSRKIIDGWQNSGATVTASTVRGDQFWSTQEIAVAPALIDATIASITGH